MQVAQTLWDQNPVKYCYSIINLLHFQVQQMYDYPNKWSCWKITSVFSNFPIFRIVLVEWKLDCFDSNKAQSSLRDFQVNLDKLFEFCSLKDQLFSNCKGFEVDFLWFVLNSFFVKINIREISSHQKHPQPGQLLKKNIF